MKNRPAYSPQCRRLQIRSLFFFGIFLLVVTGFGLWLNWEITQDMANSQNLASGAQLADQLLVQVHWQALDRPGKAFELQSEKLTRPFIDNLSKKGVDATFLYLPSAPQYTDSDSGRPTSQFESDLVTRLMRSRAEVPEVVNASPVGKKGCSYYYQAICAEKSCLFCHSTAPPGGLFATGVQAGASRLAVGDVMAVAKVSLRNETLPSVRQAWNWLIAAAILTDFVVMVAFFMVLRYVVVRAADGPRDDCPTSTEPAKRCRWFQFRLRTLLVAVLVLSLSLSWFTVRMERVKRQRETVEVIHDVDGDVLYDLASIERASSLGQTMLPSWLGNLLGVDYFDAIEGVSFGECGITRARLKGLSRLSNLKHLVLVNDQVTDDDLEYLAILANLEKLHLGSSQVTDAGLEHLEGLTRLRYLALYHGEVTDAGLEHLSKLTRLEHLELWVPRVTDAAMERVETLTYLSYLTLNYGQITDAGLEHLKGLTRLKHLDLWFTEIGDSGLEHLAGTISLEHLGLWRTQVTDKGLVHLRKLTNLQSLDLTGTQVTPEGVEQLHRAMPNCKIKY